MKEKNSKNKIQKNSNTLEGKNIKNNMSGDSNNFDKRGSYEVIENKEDDLISEKEESISGTYLKIHTDGLLNFLLYHMKLSLFYLREKIQAKGC